MGNDGRFWMFPFMNCTRILGNQPVPGEKPRLRFLVVRNNRNELCTRPEAPIYARALQRRQFRFLKRTQSSHALTLASTALWQLCWNPQKNRLGRWKKFPRTSSHFPPSSRRHGTLVAKYSKHFAISWSSSNVVVGFVPPSRIFLRKLIHRGYLKFTNREQCEHEVRKVYYRSTSKFEY